MNCSVTRSPIPIWIWNLKWIACLLAPIPLWIWDFKYIICWQGPPFLSESECEMNFLLTGSPIPHWIWNVKWMVCWQGPYSKQNPKFEINLSVDKDPHSYLCMKVDRVSIWILKWIIYHLLSVPITHCSLYLNCYCSLTGTLVSSWSEVQFGILISSELPLFLNFIVQSLLSILSLNYGLNVAWTSHNFNFKSRNIWGSASFAKFISRKNSVFRHICLYFFLYFSVFSLLFCLYFFLYFTWAAVRGLQWHKQLS